MNNISDKIIDFNLDLENAIFSFDLEDPKQKPYICRNNFDFWIHELVYYVNKLNRRIKELEKQAKSKA